MEKLVKYKLRLRKTISKTSYFLSQVEKLEKVLDCISTADIDKYKIDFDPDFHELNSWEDSKEVCEEPLFMICLNFNSTANQYNISDDIKGDKFCTDSPKEAAEKFLEFLQRYIKD